MASAVEIKTMVGFPFNFVVSVPELTGAAMLLQESRVPKDGYMVDRSPKDMSMLFPLFLLLIDLSLLCVLWLTEAYPKPI
jgi:hypothetical protein